jgi:hypothetical protein
MMTCQKKSRLKIIAAKQKNITTKIEMRDEDSMAF